MNESAPRDLDLERQVLGALLVRPDLVVQVSAIIDKEDFFFEGHRHLFDAIASINVTAQEPDPLQVIQHLKDRALLDRVGDSSTILTLAENVVAAANAPVYARRLKSLSVRRNLIETVQSIGQEAGLPHEDENQFLKSVADRVLRITNQTAADGPVLVRDARNDFIDHIEHLYRARGGISGLETGYNEFDSITSGLKGGELIVLAARPGMGKTTFAMNVAANVAVRSSKRALVYSLEMSRLELITRMLCAESRFPMMDLKRGQVPRDRRESLLTHMDRIFQAPLYIEDSGTVDIWDITTLTRKVAIDLEQKNEKLDLVIVDYLQLVGDPEARKNGRQNEVASVSRALKQLAKIVDVPVIAVSQMNRSVEQRKGDMARPQLSDLRESGAIEQDADMVLFIHREMNLDPENNPEDLEKRGLAEIIIAKHRNGPTGNFPIAYTPEINRFDNKPVDRPDRDY